MINSKHSLLENHKQEIFFSPLEQCKTNVDNSEARAESVSSERESVPSASMT